MAGFEMIREEQSWQPTGPSTASHENVNVTHGNIRNVAPHALRSDIAPGALRSETGHGALRSDTGAGPARPAHTYQEALRQFDEMDPGVQLLLNNADLLMKNGEHRLAEHLLRSLLVVGPTAKWQSKKWASAFASWESSKIL